MALFNKKKKQEEEPFASLLKNAPSKEDVLTKIRTTGSKSPIFLENATSEEGIPTKMRTTGSRLPMQSSYRNNIDTGMLDRIKELETSTGLPFGNRPTGNPFNLTTPGILEGVVKNKEMPYDNQPRVRFPDEIKAAQELASTPAPQVPEQAVPAQSQGNGSSDRINQLIALGQAMGGNADIDQMIVGAILEEMMSGGESRTDELAQAYQLTQDPLIGKEFATGLYGELGIDPIKAQKEQMLMEKFLEEFQESPETADIFEAVRRNPSLVEQYFNLTEQEGKGFLGLNNTENKRLERMRRLMGVE